MISFALLRVWQRIKNRLIQNIWLLLRLILGFTLLFFSITLMQSADQTAKEERYNDSSFKRIALLEKNEINTNERQLNKEGQTIVMVTHDKSIIQEDDQKIVLYDGKIQNNM